MIRDYAKRTSNRKKSKKKPGRSWLKILFFLVILAISLVAINKYKYLIINSAKNFISKNIGDITHINLEKKSTTAKQQPATEAITKTVATPKFDFYNTSPTKKISGIQTEYELEIAIVKDFAAADRLKAELALLGFTASITPIHKHSTQEYSVSIGPYDNKDAATIDQEKLKQDKIKSTLTKMR